MVWYWALNKKRANACVCACLVAGLVRVTAVGESSSSFILQHTATTVPVQHVQKGFGVAPQKGFHAAAQTAGAGLPAYGTSYRPCSTTLCKEVRACHAMQEGGPACDGSAAQLGRVTSARVWLPVVYRVLHNLQGRLQHAS